ncbi:MAG: hypothetical protein PVF48_05160 [Syntrophobacterales bacterium]
MMLEDFQSIVYALIRPKNGATFPIALDSAQQFDQERTDKVGVAQTLNAAFLIVVAGQNHPKASSALGFLTRMAASPEWRDAAEFYLSGIERMHYEIKTVCGLDQEFAALLKTASTWLSNKENLTKTHEVTEHLWSVFFPEANSLRTHWSERSEELRKKRTVAITKLNETPISDPAREILYTSNVLLTLPPASQSLETLPVSEDLKKTLRLAKSEPQLYWYDHPIQIGVAPEKNEVLYGLRGLDDTLEFEGTRGNASSNAKLICLLSVSVTHPSLQTIARRYIEEELSKAGGLRNIDVYVFSEADTRRLVDEILAPAALRYLGDVDSEELSTVFGVNGEYGRHYSFLKAIAALWQIVMEPEIKATFKIDLDQVFPQEQLVEQAGASAFEHFTTPLWGAQGFDSEGRPLELGMIAGALVNESDIGKSLFTPDVGQPNRELFPDEHVFFSTLPQALSTQTEMMTRYSTPTLDGKKTCIQRVHVTGGTNGILISTLRHHRPFTPSFFGRAEDQAYIFSVYPNPGVKLAYAHKDGLIMRHDKKAFAQEAIQSAHIGKLLGDYVRILFFSAYGSVLDDNISRLKDSFDPFTGCFISKIPATVVHLRFALKAASFFAGGQDKQGLEFISHGAKRIATAQEFVQGENSSFKQQLEKERLGWNLYYDLLVALEEALSQKDGFALELQEKAEKIVGACYIWS